MLDRYPPLGRCPSSFIANGAALAWWQPVSGPDRLLAHQSSILSLTGMVLQELWSQERTHHSIRGCSTAAGASAANGLSCSP